MAIIRLDHWPLEAVPSWDYVFQELVAQFHYDVWNNKTSSFWIFEYFLTSSWSQLVWNVRITKCLTFQFHWMSGSVIVIVYVHQLSNHQKSDSKNHQKSGHQTSSHQKSDNRQANSRSDTFRPPFSDRHFLTRTFLDRETFLDRDISRPRHFSTQTFLDPDISRPVQKSTRQFLTDIKVGLVTHSWHLP